MGCCLTRHPRTTSGCLFFSNKIGHESTLTSSGVNTFRHQQIGLPASVIDAWKASMAESANRRSSEVMRQAFLDGSLAPDARCPLDARQLYTLITSWNVINRNLSVTAINIFVRYAQVSTHTSYRKKCLKMWIVMARPHWRRSRLFVAGDILSTSMPMWTRRVSC